MTRSFPVALASTVLATAALGCMEPEILGLLEPDESCSYSTDGNARVDGVLDVGPTAALTHAYEAVVLVDGAGAARAEQISVAFGDADGEIIEAFDYDGRTVLLPNVNGGEREEALDLEAGEDGLFAVPFTLVTKEEAAPLQALFEPDDELRLRLELRVEFKGLRNTMPFWVYLNVCQQCLVGAGAELQDGEFVCPDGSSPTVVDDPPCVVGQDELYSTCEPGG